MQSPHAQVKQAFDSKEKLVAAVEKLTEGELWLPRLSSDKGLARVSNKKLLRLHATLTEVKEKFGSREGLVTALLELEGRAKDAGYRARLSEYPAPRLYDMYRSKSRKARSAAPAKAAPKKAAGKAKKAE